MRQASHERGETAVAERLRARREEIEQAALLRVNAVSKPPRGAGPEYVEGLRNAVATGLDYGLAGVEHGEEAAPPIPETLLAQARLAARSGVSLDTVLRRYLACHTLLDDFLIDEAERGRPLDGATLKRLLRSQAAIVDHLLAVVSNAYTEEARRSPRGSKRQKAERIERLLDGEPLDTGGLGYDFDVWHLGIVISPPSAETWIAAFARELDCRLLAVHCEEAILWAWLGSRRRLDPEAICLDRLPEQGGTRTLGMGEPGRGLSGWRLTHQQARAAMSISLRSGEPERYANVALLASVARDVVLAKSLHELYLAPLEEERDDGEALQETLRAYFDAGQNVSSAAAALGVSRQTVTSRLRTVERRIHRPLPQCSAELIVALQLHATNAR